MGEDGRGMGKKKNKPIVSECGCCDHASHEAAPAESAPPEPLTIDCAAKELSLDGDQLEGQELTQIFTCTLLAELQLTKGKLMELSPDIGKLVNLRSLVLSFNSLSCLPEMAFTGMCNLQSLVLDNNQLTSLPLTLSAASSLQTLNCSNNGLSELPEGFQMLQALLEFDLSGNKLTGVPTSLFEMPQLKDLNLARNPLTSLAAEIGQLTALTALDVSHGRLEALPTELLQCKLKKLGAAGNPFKDRKIAKEADKGSLQPKPILNLLKKQR